MWNAKAVVVGRGGAKEVASYCLIKIMCLMCFKEALTLRKRQLRGSVTKYRRIVRFGCRYV